MTWTTEAVWSAINLAAVGVMLGYQICGLACGIIRTIKYRVVGALLALVVVGLHFLGVPDFHTADNHFWILTFLEIGILALFLVGSFLPKKTAVTVK
jgi:hypothetical protein